MTKIAFNLIFRFIDQLFHLISAILLLLIKEFGNREGKKQSKKENHF